MNRLNSRQRVQVRRLLATSLVALGCLSGSAAFAQNLPQPPPREIQIMLVKNAITAVNQANLSGNYTVVRDLGARGFRERNSAATLATTFAALRDQKMDLSPILILEPKFTEQPAITPDGRLSLVGFFPTQPLQVQFRLTFLWENGGWTIDSLGVGTGNGHE